MCIRKCNLNPISKTIIKYKFSLISGLIEKAVHYSIVQLSDKVLNFNLFAFLCCSQAIKSYNCIKFGIILQTINAFEIR